MEPRRSVSTGVDVLESASRPHEVLVYGLTLEAADQSTIEPLGLQPTASGAYRYAIRTFLFEEEEGATPFTFVWDTAKLPPGEHLLTVNLLTYDDHYGVATIPVVVEAVS